MPRSRASRYLAAQIIAARNLTASREIRGITRRSKARKRYDPLDVSETEFKKRYRLSKEAFRYLCGLLCQQTNLRATKRISLEHKVLCALSFYSSGSYQRLVGMAKHLGQTTVSRYVREVTDALVSISHLFIKFPKTREERNLIKNKFYTKYGVPGVIGCIDGSHFHIFSPKKEIEHLFYCRKHFHSLNVQMICDSDCRIINVNAKFGGATHDAFIWTNSNINTYMQQLHRNNEHVWLLGDSGYPQRPWLMTPIPEAPEGSPESLYTQIHGKVRVVIENTFGRLKNRWRCLSKDRTLHYKPERCAKIILACSVLHNLALDFGLTDLDDTFIESPATQPDAPLVEASSSDDLLRGRAMREVLISKICRQRR